MKYIVINGSPHKGNTWIVTEAVIKRIKEKDCEAKFEEVHLIDEKIDFCLGCSNCFRKGPKFCPHKQVMSRILNKIEDADGVIISTTTFNTRETALLKNFLDHLNYLLHRPSFFTKKALVITTVGGYGGKSTIKSVTSTLRGMGFNKCYDICIRAISWNAYKITDKHFKIINRNADKFSSDVESGKVHFPNSEVLISYNLFRGMVKNFIDGSEYPTEDGIYYTKHNGIYDECVPLLPHQKLFGQMFYLIGKIAGKQLVVTYRK